jgi:pimeloyl-ACP methyl ester carboxylesterase
MVQAIKRDEVYIDPEGIYVETHQPERRSRKPPLLLVHGALTGSWMWSPFAAYFAERGWEAHAMNLRGHYTSDLADLSETSMRDYADDIGVAIRQLGRPPVVIAWGIGALAALLYAERRPVLGLVLLAPSPPAAALPRRADDHELHSVPDVYDARWWGWIAPMDRLRSWMPDMTDSELVKMQEMLRGAHESGSARRERMLGVEVDLAGIDAPSLVIGAGLDDVIHPSEARLTADLLGATYEYFPAASHFGLVMGSETWPQVAGSVLGWLEERRHAMNAVLAGATSA